MRASGIGALWVVQDGVLSGPGSSQSLPYVTGLSRAGFRIALLSFEKARFLRDSGRVAAVARELGRAGVRWVRFPYGRGRAASRTLVQILRGTLTGRGLTRSMGLDLVHARSYLPALMATGMGKPLLFDMRGLWPRERVDAGLWKEGSLVHRLFCRMEGWLLSRSSAVVSLAEGAREHLPPLSRPFRVIPTAVDLDRFRPGLPPPAGGGDLAGREVYVIAGALGSWYRLDAMLDLVALAVRERKEAHVLVLTEEDSAAAVAGLERRGVRDARRTVRGVPWAEVPNWFSLAAAGILLIESAPSKRASAPTKLGEFLASGVPVVISPGIGDSESLVEGTRTGVVVRDTSPGGLAAALRELGALREEGERLVGRCRRTAEKRLSLSGAVRDYADLYRLMLERDPCD